MQEVWTAGSGLNMSYLPQGKRFHLLQDVHSANLGMPDCGLDMPVMYFLV